MESNINLNGLQNFSPCLTDNGFNFCYKDKSVNYKNDNNLCLM